MKENRSILIFALISLVAEEVRINVEGGIFRKKVVHNCNKRGVEGRIKSKKSLNMQGGNVR